MTPVTWSDSPQDPLQNMEQGSQELRPIDAKT